MIKTIAIITVCFLSIACFSQEQYDNSDWHFTFTVPEDWEIATDEMLLEENKEKYANRFDGTESLALFRKAGDEETSMLVQAQVLGDVKEGLVLENNHEDWLRSNSYRQSCMSYLNGLAGVLAEQGYAVKETRAKFKRTIYYDSNSHIFFETVEIPHKDKGVFALSTVRVLGNNRITILSFFSDAMTLEGFLDTVEEVAYSFDYDDGYGFGESTGTDFIKILWHYIFPGFGTLIVCFFIYKWVASEYG